MCDLEARLGRHISSAGYCSRAAAARDRRGRSARTACPRYRCSGRCLRRRPIPTGPGPQTKVAYGTGRGCWELGLPGAVRLEPPHGRTGGQPVAQRRRGKGGRVQCFVGRSLRWGSPTRRAPRIQKITAPASATATALKMIARPTIGGVYPANGLPEKARPGHNALEGHQGKSLSSLSRHRYARRRNRAATAPRRRIAVPRAQTTVPRAGLRVPFHSTAYGRHHRRTVLPRTARHPHVTETKYGR